MEQLQTSFKTPHKNLHKLVLKLNHNVQSYVNAISQNVFFKFDIAGGLQRLALWKNTLELILGKDLICVLNVD